MPPRKPGSQVAPGQKPLFTDGRTASTHSKVPIDQATAGRRYRVRDKDWVAVWGEDLTWEAANKLKDQVVAAGKSRTARVEDMAIPPPDHIVEAEQDWARGLPREDDFSGPEAVTAAELPPHNTSATMPAYVTKPGLGVAFELVNAESQEIPSDGVVFAIPAGHQLFVNAQAVQLPAIVRRGNEVRAVALDPELARAQAAALRAVRPVASAAQARAKPRPAYRDKTVTPAARPATPPLRDKTVSKARPFVRLGAPPSAAPEPPPSPLKVATELDGDVLPDDVLGDADLADLAADVGGGPSEDDIALAQRQREQDERSRGARRS
jgi:hypothetical protein